MSRPNTNGLGERILAREEDAFLEFQYTYRRLFLTHFLRHGIPDVDAQDLTVDCLTDIPLKALTHWEPTKGLFDAWVLTLMRNSGHDWWRQHRERIVSQSQGAEFVADTQILPAADPKKVADLHERLCLLSPQDRLILELRYLREEATFQEIGEELTRTAGAGKVITEGSARVRHMRALRRLKAQYGLIEKGEVHHDESG